LADFVKSHGLGNDYIVLEPANLPFPLTPATVRLICHRNLGVGADGILARRRPGGGADFAMTIYNPDGSEAEKSGNGIRIFAKYLFDHGHTTRRAFVIETAGGSVPVELSLGSGRVAGVTADMGVAVFHESLTELDVAGDSIEVTTLSVGNPHCVLVVPDLSAVDFYRLGPGIENHPAFPDRTNVQFVQVLDRDRIRIRIWERGAGETMASGSSSCAAAAACHHRGLVDEMVVVQMDGGELRITIGTEDEIRMEGPVEETFSGDFSPELVARLQRLV
jgi:diaminopimelate epimerase